MSAQEQDVPPPGLGPEGLVAEGGLFTSELWDDAQFAAAQPAEAEAKTFIARRMAAIAKEEAGQVSQTYDQVWDFVTQAWDDGELSYTGTGDFFRYLRFNLGVPVITAGMIASGALAGYLLKYAEEHGYKP